jgi:hypothetical protein
MGVAYKAREALRTFESCLPRGIDLGNYEP